MLLAYEYRCCVCGHDLRMGGHAIGLEAAHIKWFQARGPDVVPIPGTRRRTTLDQNLDALDLRLTAADLAELETLAGQVAGERYTAEMMSSVER